TVQSVLKVKGSQVWSLGPDATAYEAIAMMADKGVGAILVISQGRLLGIISERDYARKVILKEQFSKEIMIRDIMTSSVLTVTPDHTVGECMRIVTDHCVRHLPVIEGEKVVGVISIGDLVKSTISAQEETIHHLNGYITGK
ncbi:MAG: CBS domain-containing protein, partial [Chloroflexi bacterium]|nr:CBS domain-containing protein [Chloroflexota bacterium]